VRITQDLALGNFVSRLSEPRHVQVPGASLYYAITGNGPAVLLLHGSLGSSDDWGYQVEALAAHHTVIVMDSRGQGRSTRDARPFSYDLMADDVVALLDALKIDADSSSARYCVITALIHAFAR
jgi:pimeloyl-ACP methyl ester carboxylesterase